MSLNTLMSLKHGQSKTFGVVWLRKCTREIGKQFIDRIHRKLREFDLKCVEFLMRGAKAKVKSLGQHGVYSKNEFCLLINSLQNKKKSSFCFLLKYLILKFLP